MLAKDTQITKTIHKEQDIQAIVYEMSLYSLLKIKQNLQTMLENGEIEATTTELDRSFCHSISKITTKLNRQVSAANLWQVEKQCPQCRLELTPVTETCVCGCSITTTGDRLKPDELNFLIAENCTE